MSLGDLLAEYDAKLAERFPTAHTAEPARPATVEQLRTAEFLYGAELTPELLELYEFNGTGYRRVVGYDAVRPIAQSPIEHFALQIPTPYSGGPFPRRSCVVVANDARYSQLVTPLAGEHRGEVLRLSDDGWVRCHAAHSIAAIVESWLHFLENDFLSVSPYKQIVVRGSTFEVENGPSSFEMLFPAWPTANPLAIDHFYDRDNPEHVDLIARHTEGYEFDPRGSELHPENDDFFAEHTDDLNAELTSLEVAFRRRTT